MSRNDLNEPLAQSPKFRPKRNNSLLLLVSGGAYLPRHFSLHRKFSKCWFSGFVRGENCPEVGCWAPTSGYVGPELRDQAEGRGGPHMFEWPAPIDMPGAKMLLKPLGF